MRACGAVSRRNQSANGMSAIPVPLVAATTSRLLPQRLGRWSLGDAATVTPARGAFSTARSRIADAGLIEPVVTPAH